MIRIALVLSLAVHGACASTDSSSTSKDTSLLQDLLSTEVPEEARMQAGECPPPRPACPDVYDPVQCSASKVSQHRLAKEKILLGWGDNQCQGQLALRVDACRQGLSPNKLRDIVCVPDATSGACPPASHPCGQDLQPSICTVTSYQGQKLRAGQILSAAGANPCVAQNKIQLAACARNLDPKWLGPSSCAPDPTEGECAFGEISCNDQNKKSICTVSESQDGPIEPALIARGDSLCAAKVAALRAACGQNIRPSRLGKFRCYDETATQGDKP